MRAFVGSVILVAFAFVCRAGSAFAADAPALHPLTVEDLLGVQQVSRVDLSPDARQVLFIVQGTNLAANAPSSKVFVADTQAGHVPQAMPAEAAQSQWRSDSKTLSYLKPEGDCTRIWQIPIDQPTPKPLSNVCLPSKDRLLISQRWSADGRFLAYLSQPVTHDPLAELMARQSAPKPESQPTACLDLNSEEARAKGFDALDLACTGTSVGTGWMWGYDVASPAYRYFSTTQTQLPASELWVFDATNGSSRRISTEGADVRLFDWSAKGHQLIWFALAPDSKIDPRAPYSTGSGSLTAFGGAASIYWSDAAASSAPDSFAIGSLTAFDLFFVQGLRWSPNGAQVALGTREALRLFTVKRGAQTPKDIFKGRSAQFDWSADGHSLFVLRYAGHLQSLVKVDVASGKLRNGTDDPRWHNKPSFSADHHRFAIAIEDMTEPAQVYVGDDHAAALRLIVGHDRLNPGWRRATPLIHDRIDWRSWDDKWDLYGVILKSGGGEPKTIRPMVVVVLGAGQPTNRQFGIDTQQPILPLAAAGYTVFITNDRSRSGITPGGYEQLGAERTYFSKPWQDQMQGVDLMVSKGMADPARIGIMGYSYGGGLVSWGLGHTTRFKAAVLKEPVAPDMAASWRGIWGHKGFGGDVISKQYGIESPYEGDGARFIEYESAIKTVQAVRTPTLLEYGTKSGNIQLGGNEFYQGLIWYGVPAELVMYPRTFHGFVEPVLVADAFRREVTWFEKWLPSSPQAPP